MRLSKAEYDRIEKQILNVVNNSSQPATTSEVSRVVHKSYPFTQKVLDKLETKKEIAKKKYADRTFYFNKLLKHNFM